MPIQALKRPETWYAVVNNDGKAPSKSVTQSYGRKHAIRPAAPMAETTTLHSADTNLLVLIPSLVVQHRLAHSMGPPPSSNANSAVLRSACSAPMASINAPSQR